MVMKLNNNGLGLILAGIATFGGLFGALNGGGHMAAGAAFGAAFGGSFGLIGGGLMMRNLATACMEKEKTLAAGIDL